MNNNNTKAYILPIIVFAQFACTSMWFAGNAVLGDIVSQYHLHLSSLKHITSGVQMGFIAGTLVFAMFTISDRFSPSKVFLASAIAGAIFNLTILLATTLPLIIATRIVTGFCLAGIYPVGMKIAADYHEKGLGKALGFLVGALVLGTAFPHLLKSLTANLPWKTTIFCTSALSIFGGLLIYMFVADGPFKSKAGKPNLIAFIKVFQHRPFRIAACGYFGHMWELYSFWAFVPVLIGGYQTMHDQPLDNSLFSFATIASGTIGCVAGGYISNIIGSYRTAFIALGVSFICCILSPIILYLPFYLFLIVMLVWGMAVIADSPQFSALVARSALAEVRGTALTIVNCIGFFITIISLQVVGYLQNLLEPQFVYLVLSIGPLLGLVAMRRASAAEKKVGKEN